MLEKERKQNANGFLCGSERPTLGGLGWVMREERTGGACGQDWQAGDKRIAPMSRVDCWLLVHLSDCK